MIYIYIYIYFIHICIHTYTNRHIYAHTHTHKHIYIYILPYLYLYNFSKNHTCLQISHVSSCKKDFKSENAPYKLNLPIFCKFLFQIMSM